MGRFLNYPGNIGEWVPNATTTDDGFMSAADKLRLDNLTSGIAPAWKETVQVAEQNPISISSLPATIDGATLANGDRFIAVAQADTSQNGVWLYTAAGQAATRPPDFTGANTVNQGDILYVYGGTAAGIWLRITTANPITVDTTALAFAPFSVVTMVSAKQASGRSGAGTVTLTGAVVGDIVVTWAPFSGTFPATPCLFASSITVADQIQQLSAGDFSATQFTFIMLRLFT